MTMKTKTDTYYLNQATKYSKQENSYEKLDLSMKTLIVFSERQNNNLAARSDLLAFCSPSAAITCFSALRCRCSLYL